jgi:hypothetical protein
MGDDVNGSNTVYRRGENYGFGTGNSLRPDERAVLDYMRAIESDRRPGVVVLYWNGSNWVSYENPQARWLPRG